MLPIMVDITFYILEKFIMTSYIEFVGKMKRWFPILIVILLCGNFLFPIANTSKGSFHELHVNEKHQYNAITCTLNESKAKSLYYGLLNASTIEEQFTILKRYGLIPENASLPKITSPSYKGPYLFSLISVGLALPPLSLTIAMIIYGYIFHLFPLSIILINILFKLINLITPPPLPEISTGYIFLEEGFYKFMVETPTYNYSYDSWGYMGAIELVSYGFVGWKIFIPVDIFTGFELEIFGIPIPIPISITILIGASLYLLYRCY